jgi:hypothetical protein
MACIFVLATGACATLKLPIAQEKCNNGSKLECARAGVYQYKTGNRDAGFQALKRGCFEDGLKQACDWFEKISPVDFKMATLEIQQKREEVARRNEEAARQLEHDRKKRELEKKLADDKIDCQKRMVTNDFSSFESCLTAKNHKAFGSCENQVKSKKWPGMEKCIWAEDHPIEASCETEVKQFGGSFWDCVKVKYERQEAQEALRIQRESIEKDLEISKRNIEEIARQKQLDRIQIQRVADEEMRLQRDRDRAKDWKEIGESFKGPKKVECTSNTVYGKVTTECTESRQ